MPLSSAQLVKGYFTTSMNLENWITRGNRNTKLQAALQERRRDDGGHWEVNFDTPSERINAAETPALASGYAVTL